MRKIPDTYFAYELKERDIVEVLGLRYRLFCDPESYVGSGVDLVRLTLVCVTTTAHRHAGGASLTIPALQRVMAERE